MMRMMVNETSLSRRSVLAGLGATAMMALAPVRALAAMTADQAEGLIDKVVADINGIINSGSSEATMIKNFENVFVKYADVDFIAMSALGADGRSASASQKAAFIKAFRKYIAKRYGSRFREFEGGRINVIDSKQVKSRFEVLTKTELKGSSPFDVVFIVSAKNGRFIDMKVEGISIVLSERKEIGAMLDSRKGNLDQLIADLNG